MNDASHIAVPAQTANVDQPAASDQDRTPLCFVVDEEASIRRFLNLILHGMGIDCETFADGTVFREAIATHRPDLIFMDIPLDSTDTIESMVAMGRACIPSTIQLMSSRGSAVLEHVKSVGEHHKLNILPVLKKPFETSMIVRIVQNLKIGFPQSVAARIGLNEAIDNNWIEFWYQPKIDLRRKQLVGAEAFSRVRHPEHGILAPAAFIPGATESELTQLSERALVSALNASKAFTQLGLNLRNSVNIPLVALANLDVEAIVRTHFAADESWPGLVIDVPEEQIVYDLPLAGTLSRKFSPLNVKLAIDDFGRGYSSLAKLKEMPFAELKLDQTFVTDCGTDKVNAPLCKTVIDLAHNFGSMVVALGVEKAADAIALVSMGCDLGQGFLFGEPMPQQRFISLLRQRAKAQGYTTEDDGPLQRQSA